MTDEQRIALTGLDYNTLALKVIALEQQLLETRSNGEALRIRVEQLEGNVRALTAARRMAAGEPSNGVCHECGNALTRNEHGTWRCKGCEGRRFDTTWTYDDDGLSGEES